jgi:hypothetical protein
MYQLFYDGDEPPQLPNLLKRKPSDDIVWGSARKDALYLHKLRKCLSKAAERDRKILLSVAQNWLWVGVASRKLRAFRLEKTGTGLVSFVVDSKASH